MIERASLSKEFFVVLLPGGQVKQRVNIIQKEISRRYGLMESDYFPEVHITIDRLNKNLINEADIVIRKVIKNSTPVEIVLNEFTCYHRTADNNFLVMQLKETPSLKEFTSNLHQELISGGISSIHNYDEWKFHITVVSNLFASHPLPEIDFNGLCMAFEGEVCPCSSVVERLEIWRPTIDLENRCVRKYLLTR